MRPNSNSAALKPRTCAELSDVKAERAALISSLQQMAAELGQGRRRSGDRDELAASFDRTARQVGRADGLVRHAAFHGPIERWNNETDFHPRPTNRSLLGRRSEKKLHMRSLFYQVCLRNPFEIADCFQNHLAAQFSQCLGRW